MPLAVRKFSRARACALSLAITFSSLAAPLALARLAYPDRFRHPGVMVLFNLLIIATRTAHGWVGPKQNFVLGIAFFASILAMFFIFNG